VIKPKVPKLTRLKANVAKVSAAVNSTRLQLKVEHQSVFHHPPQI
jgi:hypothetical protein